MDKVVLRYTPSSGARFNLRIDGHRLRSGGAGASNVCAFEARESKQGSGGKDWNGDSDTSDEVIHAVIGL